MRPTAVTGPTSTGVVPFKYVGGDPGLDLVNTVDWTDRGPENDRLADYGRLLTWAAGAGVLPAGGASSLRREAAARPDRAAAAWDKAVELRSVLKRLFDGMAVARVPGPALDQFNGLLKAAVRRLRIAPESRSGQARRLGWAWYDQDRELEAPLWPVIWSVARLVASDEARQIRVCAGEGCGWVYVDRSRNGFRRWCEMATCGTRAKGQRRRARGGA